MGSLLHIGLILFSLRGVFHFFNMGPTTFLLALVGSFILLHDCNASISERTKMLNALLDPNSYDSRVRPNEGSSPVKIVINGFIASLTSLSESDMDFTIDMYLRQTWTDDRLKHNSSKYLVVPPRFVDKIWYPDLFFSNEKRGELHTITQPNRYIRITKEGEVLLSQRFTLTLSCPMALHKFPFDSQKCGLKMESYGYSTDEVVFQWSEKKEGPIQIDENTQIPNYDLTDTVMGDCTKVYSTGSFTCLEATLSFGRQIGYFLFNNFIPSFILVATTWLGFWLLPSPAVTRVTLISISLLSMIGLIQAAKNTAPQVSYIVAIDVWMVMSMIFIILALLETIFVAWMYQKGEQSEASEEKLEPGVRRKRSCCNWKGCAIKVDILSRLLIPALYFGWAGFYWFVYTKFDL